MQIKEIADKNLWEKFLEGCCPKTFLQSWNWGEFSKRMGQKIWRLGVYENNQLLAACLSVKVKAKRGTFLMVEHGPNIKFKIQNSKFKILSIFLDKLKQIAKEEKASFIRVCPIWERTEENEEVFKKLGFRDAPIHIHPEVSWILDLDKSEKELLYGMRKTTRYLIRQAQKNKDLEVVKSQSFEDLEKFYNLYQETVKRHKFVPFSFNYLKTQLEVFREDNQILIFLGKYKKEIISGAVIVYWQNGAFYHHGASLRKYSKIPASYLIQWEAIKEAKKRGSSFYSFWGIAPENRPNHPWRGLTLFKKGFGGRKEEYVKTKDYVLSSKYIINYLVETLRKIKRGYY
ncbi:MAG: peptidoglycan bridge formation glycyltransferase FemA/FemB family protein [Candidatus Pacebacteria bacterium]|nr:peptidoglycan bridge formation glycyltransferase FemA/FemB family protein [Candidatus Paceibacterota bacterium]